MKNEFDYLNDVKMDFSCYEQGSLNEREFDFMKHNKYNKKMIILAACIATFAFTTAFASGLAGNIIKSISTGFNSYVQVDPDAPVELMDEMKGKIFDANGNALEALRRTDIENIYDKDGNKITPEIYANMIEEATDGIVTYSGDYDPEKSEKTFDTFEEAQESAVFDIKTPEWMPEDYLLSRIYAYKSEDGTLGGEYMNLVYKNAIGDEIVLYERMITEDTAFEAGTDGDLKEISINGRKGVIMNGRILGFETEDNVSVSIVARGNISEDELIKIAKSVE